MIVTTGMLAGPAASARAAYIVTVQPVGQDVVAVGSGSINLAALTPVFSATQPAAIAPIVGRIVLGPTQDTLSIEYRGTSTGMMWGTGSYNLARRGNGPMVEVGMYAGILSVPAGYVSGTPLGISTSTWVETNYASLGLKPGTYISTWGSGASADSFTVNVLVPEPSTALATASLFGMLVARRRAKSRP